MLQARFVLESSASSSTMARSERSSTRVHHPGGNDAQTFHNSLNAVLENEVGVNGSSIFVGGLNVNIGNPLGPQMDLQEIEE